MSNGFEQLNVINVIYLQLLVPKKHTWGSKILMDSSFL